LIQHSFALRTHERHRPFYGTEVEERVRARFEVPGAGFEVESVVRPFTGTDPRDAVAHSLLVDEDLTTIEPQRSALFTLTENSYEQELPPSFAWAGHDDPKDIWDRFVFADRDKRGEASLNDFIVHCGAGSGALADDETRVSRALGELLAYRRSMLFGLALGNRFVNVTLPYALLKPEPAPARCPGGSWILQPVVSLIRVGRDGDNFRRVYSISLFLIPVGDDGSSARKMSIEEMRRMVRTDWGLAGVPREIPRYLMVGPLRAYLLSLGFAAGEHGHGKILTLRQAVESLAFAVALRMVQGPQDSADDFVRREIGNDVVTSIGNCRVSSVLVVDPRLSAHEVGDRLPQPVYPGSLERVMRALAGENRLGEARKYRLDRDYCDNDDYAIGVLPASRCTVLASSGSAQHGRSESGLLQAGWMAYMAIGAATAIGMIRAIHRDLERLDRSEPTAVAKIERDVVVDLHEIYDLDITWEAYRHRYRLLRTLLGVTADYQALHGKLQALYRETDARFEARTQRRLIVLTAAIVILSAFILAGTILLAVK
jgi:hypothetical protein